MELIAGALNKQWLQNLVAHHTPECTEVVAAIAYAGAMAFVGLLAPHIAKKLASRSAAALRPKRTICFWAAASSWTTSQ